LVLARGLIETMKKMTLIFWSTLIAITPLQNSQAGEQAYQGQENRQIKSLSDSDIAAIENGNGWGLAKAAELNGIPGPAHVLELQKKLNLNRDQMKKIQIIWQEMNTAAKQQGLLYLKAESDIEDYFRQKQQDQQTLSALLKQSAQALAELRQVHLVAHLKTRPILSNHQVMLYKKLRGYKADSHHHHNKHH
ncbi:MAG: hypothetical protein AAFZ92_09105, partial [Pseudomonadota bacterium]